ncbi:cyclin-dependent kinase inhibitor 3-like [Ptychodera flava]|uniref:cyclin-dependent kinase inhibitor 3-like n=1 Tax=Ptychodera flava TaxID=63121 RepID=UPI00396A1A43
MVRLGDQRGAMSNFDSSDEEGDCDLTPFKIDWLDYSDVGCPEDLGISSLPGCRFKDVWRSLDADIDCLKEQEIQEIFVLCTRGEMTKYRVPRLLQEYHKEDFTVHHYAFPDGSVPPIANCMKLLEELRVCLMSGRRSLIHCYGGLGRSCVVAVCLMLMMDENMEVEEAIQRVRTLRGSGAIQTVKQYNFVHDFRKIMKEYEATKEGQPRSLSR